MAHRIGAHRESTRSRRALVALLSAGVMTAGLAVASPAHATLFGKLNTSTTLTVSPTSATEGTAITFNASVKIAVVNSLGVIPKGTVTFTVKNASNATFTVGTASLRSCFLLPCHAIVTSSSVPVGTTSAFATYNGDSGTNPSTSPATPLTISANPNPGTSSEVTCYAGQPCDSGTLTTNDSSTQADVNSGPSSNSQTVSAALTDGTLHCQEVIENDNDGDDDDGVFVGALLTFSTTATDSTKTVTKTGTGSVGATMKHQLAEHPNRAGCWGSPSQFKGFTNGTYGPAVWHPEDGLYEAILATCAYTQSLDALHRQTLPCMTGVAGPSGTTTFTYKVSAPAGDPKFI